MAEKKLVRIDPTIKMLHSLRSNSLSNTDAVKDLIDNSLDTDVGATTVDIKITDDHIIIADDGSGMTLEVLHDAMRLGSEGKVISQNVDLGLFGMGLNNSSMALGRKLTVLTKPNGKIYSAEYDLEVMEDFAIPVGEASKEEAARFKELTQFSKSKTGTVIIIEKLDRIRTTTNIFINDLLKDVGECFRIFITDGVTININGKKVEPISPFDVKWTTEKQTEINDQTYEFKKPDGTKFSCRIRVGLLPSVTEDENKRTGVNPDNQGFYVLRNNRQIASRKWFDMWTKHPQYNRIRIELFFEGTEDEAFGVTFEKNKVKLQQWLRDQIKNHISGQVRSLVTRARTETAVNMSNSELLNDLSRIKKDIDSRGNRLPALRKKDKGDKPVEREPSGKPPKEIDPDKPKRPYPPGTTKSKVERVDFDLGHLGSRLCNFEDMGNGAVKIRFNVDHVFFQYFSQQDIETKKKFVDILLVFGRAFVRLYSETPEYAKLIEDLEMMFGDEARKLMD